MVQVVALRQRPLQRARSLQVPDFHRAADDKACDDYARAHHEAAAHDDAPKDQAADVAPCNDAPDRADEHVFKDAAADHAPRHYYEAADYTHKAAV